MAKTVIDRPGSCCLIWFQTLSLDRYPFMMYYWSKHLHSLQLYACSSRVYTQRCVLVITREKCTEVCREWLQWQHHDNNGKHSSLGLPNNKSELLQNITGGVNHRAARTGMQCVYRIAIKASVYCRCHSVVMVTTPSITMSDLPSDKENCQDWWCRTKYSNWESLQKWWDATVIYAD